MENSGEIKASARMAGIFDNVIRLYFWKRNEERQLIVLSGDDGWKQHTEQAVLREDVDGIDLMPTSAQALMDSLWNCGVRPTEGKGSAGAMSEAQERIKDLKSINDWLMDQLDRLNRPTIVLSTLEEKISHDN